ncbi:MAG: MFS transporter [Pseudomonadota bacterium]
MDQSKRSYWLLSGAFFSFFLCWSFSFSLFPIWLSQAVGLSGEDIGVIFSVGAVAALFIMPCYGYLQDKLGLRKHLLLFVAAAHIGSGPFLIYVYGPNLAENLLPTAVLGGVYFGIAFGAGVGALETYIERVSRFSGFEFGKARMWGSLGWAAATFLAGRLFNIDPNINFVLASFSAIVFFVLVALVKPAVDAETIAHENEDAAHLKLSDAFALLADRKFWALATFVMGVSCIYTVYDQQFPVYFSSLFPTLEKGNEMFGYLNSFQVFLEAGGMFLAPFLVNRIGAKNGLVLSGVVMALRVIGSGYSDGAIEISIMKLLHAVELPIMLVSLFKYISATFDSHLSATIYIVGFQFMTQVAASGLSIVAGMMYDSLGFSTSYKILGFIVAFFVVVSWFVLTNDKTAVDESVVVEPETVI